MSGSRVLVAGSFFAAVLCNSARAQVTQRLSVASGGSQLLFGGDFPSISGDGRYVAFRSSSDDVVPGDTNFSSDVFVHDRLSGTTERVSVGPAGAQADSASAFDARPSISGNGRYVAFASHAHNLVTADTNGVQDIFVHDRQSGVTECVSVDSLGTQGNGESDYPAISADGRYVAFVSVATNLVAGDTNGFSDVFVHDRQSGVTERVSVDSTGTEAKWSALHPSISADGRYVAFDSHATNLVPGDLNGWPDVFLHDRQAATTELISISATGSQGNSISWFASVSGDGRFVVFVSHASNLVTGDTNGRNDVFLRDRQMGTTERVSVDSLGLEGDFDSGFPAKFPPSVSTNGRSIAFWSGATNLVAGDTNAKSDVFLRDRQAAVTERLSVDSTGAQGDNDSGYFSDLCMSADGRYAAFQSSAGNLVQGDSNGLPDAFLRDRFASGFRSVCDPGVGGVITCPCANPPRGAGRGCDNSSSTGGAVLSASGAAYLAADSLVFTTSEEKPAALSTVTQWTGLSASGVVFGMGVRCATGTFKRLYTKLAVGGSVTAPDLSAGDARVSIRSAALGDQILAGQSRWYVVYYRDPLVLGGCPSTSTFNATQTGEVAWWP